jgi:hypothetical protein
MMKFDTTRATETVHELREVAGGGPRAITQFVDAAAERFEAIGWTVERSSVVSARRRWSTFWRAPHQKPFPMIIARPRSGAAAPVRVIVSTPVCSDRARGQAGMENVRLPIRDVAGSAFLLELARTWPKSREQRLEVVATIAAGQTPFVPGSQDLQRRVQKEWEPKSTLLVVVYGPGLGRDLVVDAFPDRQIVREAAEGLWVPIRLMSQNPLSAQRVRWPLRASFPERVVMAGAESFQSREPVLDPAALGRAEQLTSEIVLRWARRHAGQSAQEGQVLRKEARSSQNPG